jgi:nitrogen fixation protein
LTILASGTTALAYQWKKNGTPIAGATGATYNIASALPTDAGSYTCVVTNSAGSIVSAAATLTVNSSRLANLSVRAPAGTGDQTLIVGFYIGGVGSKQVLLRGIGPTLAQYGVSGVLADPQLKLFNTANTQINQNDDWGGSAALANAFASVNDFALPANSKDAALLVTLPPAGYSAQVNGAGTSTGVALIEAYEADIGTPGARFTALSARNQVGTGDNILIAGFAVTGNAPKTLLIRGVGPTLANFGVNGVLADPRLDLYSGNTKIGENDNWGGTTSLSDAFTVTQAFPLPTNSKDAALLVTLQPGVYSAQVSGFGSTTGVALVEVYEMP